jgi:hypothetical protein
MNLVLRMAVLHFVHVIPPKAECSLTIYELVRHRIRPPTEPVCEGCQQDLPVADDGDWLTYRRTSPQFERRAQ